MQSVKVTIVASNPKKLQIWQKQKLVRTQEEKETKNMSAKKSGKQDIHAQKGRKVFKQTMRLMQTVR